MPLPTSIDPPDRAIGLRLHRPGAAVRTLALEALSAAAFAPFGDVIAAPAEGGVPANDGTALRFDDIARLELTAQGGRPMLSWFRVRPAQLPFTCKGLERHPLSSQIFLPLAPCRFLVLVAPPAALPEAGRVRAFLTRPGQGVNYRPGVWHHPVLALEAETDFLMLGRAGPGDDLDLAGFADGARLEVAAGALSDR